MFVWALVFHFAGQPAVVDRLLWNSEHECVAIRDWSNEITDRDTDLRGRTWATCVPIPRPVP